MAEEKLLSKIRGLIDKANATEFPAERDAFLAKAEQLMQQHEIDGALLDASRPSERREIITRDIERATGEFATEMRSMLSYFAEHRGVKVATKRFGFGKIVTSMVGFPDDIDFVEMLYTTTMLDFASKITPSWDPRSAGSPAVFDHNVRAFKEAGYKWVEIAKMANKHGGNPRTGMDGSTTDGAWLKAAYRRECVRLGVAPTRQTQRHEAFRATFATGYVAMIYTRLRKMRMDAETASGVISGNLPAVRDSRERVNEEFYRLYPHMRPATPEELAERKAKYEAEQEQERKERQEFLDSLTDAQRALFLAKEERQMDRENAKWDRESRSRYDENGWTLGQRAAQQVDLSGGVNHLKGKKEIV